jgi:two-component system response regulator FlrC
LFGYEKGAFTGAVQACSGKFEQAQNGTILLDEITEMDLSLQAKLLRVLQEKEVERLGGRKTIKLDVRVIATSNRDLKQAVADGKFREDLYYRLNVFPLTWHPLSERPLDIVPIAEHLIERHARAANTAIPTLSETAKQKLTRHFWPGNVRELDNVMQRAMILKLNDDIDADAILIEEYAVDSVASASVNNYSVEEAQAPSCTDDLDDEISVSGGSRGFKDEIRDQEFKLILDTIRACNGKRTVIAEKLGISPRTLRYKIARMREHGIEIPA